MENEYIGEKFHFQISYQGERINALVIAQKKDSDTQNYWVELNRFFEFYVTKTFQKREWISSKTIPQELLNALGKKIEQYIPALFFNISGQL